MLVGGIDYGAALEWGGGLEEVKDVAGIGA